MSSSPRSGGVDSVAPQTTPTSSQSTTSSGSSQSSSSQSSSSSDSVHAPHSHVSTGREGIEEGTDEQANPILERLRQRRADGAANDFSPLEDWAILDNVEKYLTLDGQSVAWRRMAQDVEDFQVAKRRPIELRDRWTQLVRDPSALGDRPESPEVNPFKKSKTPKVAEPLSPRDEKDLQNLSTIHPILEEWEELPDGRYQGLLVGERGVDIGSNIATEFVPQEHRTLYYIKTISGKIYELGMSRAEARLMDEEDAITFVELFQMLKQRPLVAAGIATAGAVIIGLQVFLASLSVPPSIVTTDPSIPTLPSDLQPTDSPSSPQQLGGGGSGATAKRLTLTIPRNGGPRITMEEGEAPVEGEDVSLFSIETLLIRPDSNKEGGGLGLLPDDTFGSRIREKIRSDAQRFEEQMGRERARIEADMEEMRKALM